MNMISILVVFLVVAITITVVSGTLNNFSADKQEWGFANVRKGAHMFWWLHYTTANVSLPTERPLAIWLQGGPGSSSSGYGNFEELGPFDTDLNERNHTWVKNMNVLFIDSPIGSGFSYVENTTYLCKTNEQVIKDLVELLRQFFGNYTQFSNVPLHIFGESYGGKVAVELAYALSQETQQANIACSLKSVTSIDGWISPIDFVITWAPYLFNLGFVDYDGHRKIMERARLTQKAYYEHQYERATKLWASTEKLISVETHGIDLYNVMRPTNVYNDIEPTLKSDSKKTDKVNILDKLMKEHISKILNIPSTVVWGSQSTHTFNAMCEDFMKSSTVYVERLLNETSVEVNILTGQLDLIVDTPGTVRWVNRLKWNGAVAFKDALRRPIYVENILEGFFKNYDKFTLFWVNRAGHMVPADNPIAMDFILKKVTNYHL